MENQLNSATYGSDFSLMCLTLFSSVNKISTQFLLPLFLVRVSIFNFTGSSPIDIGKLIKAVIVYFLLIASYSSVLDIILSMPDYMNTLHKDNLMVFQNKNNLNDMLVPYTLRLILESISTVVYRLGQSVFHLFVLVMSGLAPIIFLLGTIMGIGIGIKLFYGLVVISGMWPIVWYGLDMLFFKMADGQSGIYIIVFDLLVSCLKVFMPFGLGFVAMNASPASFVSALGSKGLGTIKSGGLKAASFAMSGGSNSSINRTALGLGKSNGSGNSSKSSKNMSNQSKNNTGSISKVGISHTNSSQIGSHQAQNTSLINNQASSSINSSGSLSSSGSTSSNNTNSSSSNSTMTSNSNSMNTSSSSNSIGSSSFNYKNQGSLKFTGQNNNLFIDEMNKEGGEM